MMRITTWDGKTINPDNWVHEDSKGRWVIARWLESNACYVADMTVESRRLTGASQVRARTIDGISSSPNVKRYRSRAAAIRALRRRFEDD